MIAAPAVAATAVTATEIRLNRSKDGLEITFSDGMSASLSAEFLRVESPSAEVQGHHAAQKQLVAGKRHVTITGIKPTGNYAVTLTFSDGHETGIFSWTILHMFSRNHAQLWQDYLQNLAGAGLSRD